jgi:predicted RNase H-like HicB family nuclease
MQTKGNNMKHNINAYVYKGEEYYVAECADIGVVTQGKTLDETIANLREAISLHLEGENPAEYDLVENPTIRVTHFHGSLNRSFISINNHYEG